MVYIAFYKVRDGWVHEVVEGSTDEEIRNKALKSIERKTNIIIGSKVIWLEKLSY